ncbi:MAG: class I adenylate-forming enzyme family protein [Novosphingobium sp.]
MTTPRAIVDLEAGLSLSQGIPLEEEQGIGPLTLGGYVREVARRYGDAEAAVIHMDGQALRWSYTELLDHAMEVARSLVACGVGRGTRVGILATNRLEFLSCIFGTALAGGIATTISTFFTAAELEVVLKESGCSVLLLERNVLKKDFARMLVEIAPSIASATPGDLACEKLPFLTHAAMIDSDEGLGGIEGWATFRRTGACVDPAIVHARADAVAASDPGVLFFSSGSTGKVKGILSAHRGVCLQLWRWAQWYDLKEPPRTWSANGFFWSGNFAMALGGTLSSGGSLLLQRWFNAGEALQLMQAEKGTMVLAWPHQWQQLIEAPNYTSVDLSSLYYIDRDTPLAQHPTVSSGWKEPFHAYGNTETFTLISLYPANSPEEITLGSHGVPTAGSTIKIVDPMTGAIMPLGERGEIAVKGPTLMLGYIGIPLADSLDGDGFLRCGDGGYIDREGRLWWEGRLNDIIKTGGANVSPIEIDDHLRDCPGVKVAKTVGVPDELHGELVVTCIVAHDGASVSEDDVKAYARTKLASYKVPRKVLFFAEDELETTGSAKIKTAELRKLATERLAKEA